MRIIIILSSCILLAVSGLSIAKDLNLQSRSDDNNLPAQVIRAVLRELGMTYVHPYDSEADITPLRIYSDVQNGDLDFMWFMTTPELEEKFEVIYFPVYRGTLGMRLGIVKRENKNIFSKVRNIDELRSFTAGQGKTWSDTFILEANNLKVAKTLKYQNLFLMLEGERFDYFPRGFYEPWGEIERYAELNLVVEPHILIRYTAPLYFYTRKGNKALAQKVLATLKKMVADGSYQKLFFANSQVKEGLDQAQLNKRVVIELNNPFLTEKTPLADASLWYDPSTGR